MKKIIPLLLLIALLFCFQWLSFANETSERESCIFTPIFEGNEIVWKIQWIQWSQDGKNIAYILRTSLGTQVIYNWVVLWTYLRVLDMKFVSETNSLVYAAEDLKGNNVLYRNNTLEILPYPEISNFTFSGNGTSYAYIVPYEYKIDTSNDIILNSEGSLEFIVENWLESKYIMNNIKWLYFTNDWLLVSSFKLIWEQNNWIDIWIELAFISEWQEIFTIKNSPYFISNSHPDKIKNSIIAWWYDVERDFNFVPIQNNTTVVFLNENPNFNTIDDRLRNYLESLSGIDGRFLQEYEENNFESWEKVGSNLFQFREWIVQNTYNFPKIDDIKYIWSTHQKNIYVTSSIYLNNTDINKEWIYLQSCNGDITAEYIKAKIKLNKNFKVRKYLRQIDSLVISLTEERKKEIVERINNVQAKIKDENLKDIIEYLRVSLLVE